MASYLTSTTLIESIERRGNIPVSQSTYDSDDYLALASEEMSMGMVPAMLVYHEEFFVYPSEIALVANVSSYPIPDRAIGNKFRDIFYKDNNGNLREMTRIAPEQVPFFQNRSLNNSPYCFYFQNNSVILVPEITTNPTGSLIINYFQRPNQLVANNKVANIESINFTTGEVVLVANTLPSTFSTEDAYDFLELKGAHKCRAIDITPTSVSSTLRTMTFNPSDLPSGLIAGDQIAFAGESCIPQIPDELHSVLAQRVVCRIMEAQGDQAGLQAANGKLADMEQRMGSLIDNRSDGNPQKVNNLHGPLRIAKMRRRRSTY